jgi:hypothetical protein
MNQGEDLYVAVRSSVWCNPSLDLFPRAYYSKLPA